MTIAEAKAIVRAKYPKARDRANRGDRMKPERGVYTASEVRFQLYERWNKVQEWWNNHLADEHFPKPHAPDCRICAMRRAEQGEILRLVRIFGGNPRR